MDKKSVDILVGWLIKIREKKMFNKNLMIRYIIIILPLFSNCGSNQESVKIEIPLPVETSFVQKKEVSMPIHTSGKLYTSTESKLSFKIPGIVGKIFVREGQAVAKNTILASLDLIEMQARVHQARSAAQKAERDLERIRRLFADSVVTLEQMQNTKTALEVASSDLEVAEFNLRYSKIIAPERGKILKRFAEEGELINAGTPLFLFGAEQEGWVMRVAVTDRRIVTLKLGDQAEIQFDTYKDHVFPANVSEIQAIANPYTGTFEVELKLQPTELKLYSGFVGRVKLLPEEKDSYYILPIESLVEGNGRNGYIFRVERNTMRVTRQQIQIFTILDDQLLIQSGLQEGQEIVTFGSSYLTDNGLIEVVDNTSVSRK
jgi:RND family efflux transporter MFP subunit